MFIKNQTKRQFDATLKREGQTVYDYFTLEEYKVFFRRSFSSNVSAQKIKIYFDQETNIHKGSILMFKNDIYIVGVLNYYESDVYFAAEATKCITRIPAGTNEIPLAITSNTLSADTGTVRVISGTGSFYTQFNDQSKNIKINNRYNIFGREYKILNTLNIDGILFITAEMEAAYQGGISQVSYLGQSTTDKKMLLQYSLVQTASNDIYYASDNIVGYESSDPSVAIVDKNGILTPISDGTTTITLTYRVNGCLENNSDVESTYTHQITVNAQPTPPPQPPTGYTCTVTHNGLDTIKTGGSKTFTVNCFEGGTEVGILPGVWSYKGTDSSDYPISNTDLMNNLTITDIDSNSKKIKLNNNSTTASWYNGKLTVNYTLDDNSYIGSDVVIIKPL